MHVRGDPVDGLRNLGERHVLEDCLAAFDGAPLSRGRADAVAGMASEVSGMASALGRISAKAHFVAPQDARRLHDLTRLMRLTDRRPDAGLGAALSDLSAAMARLAEGMPATASRAGEALARDWLAALRWRAG